MGGRAVSLQMGWRNAGYFSPGPEGVASLFPDPVLVIRFKAFFPPFEIIYLPFFFLFSAHRGSKYFNFLVLTCKPRSISCVVFFCFKVHFG